LIERLLDAYPEQIAGIKDSSNDWNNMRAMLERFQPRGFNVFAGNESFLLRTMKMGGAGCISALANVNGGAIARLYREWKAADAESQQTGLDDVRNAFAKFPMIPALKAAVAHFTGDASWANVRPPLVAVSREQREALVAAVGESLAIPAD
jgi:4-hydroxy-tetrahydrodipicolinate synthase